MSTPTTTDVLPLPSSARDRRGVPRLVTTAAARRRRRAPGCGSSTRHTWRHGDVDASLTVTTPSAAGRRAPGSSSPIGARWSTAGPGGASTRGDLHTGDPRVSGRVTVHPGHVRPRRRRRRARHRLWFLFRNAITDVLTLSCRKSEPWSRMSLRYKKRLVVKNLQKDAVIREGIVYNCKYLRLSVYAKGIRPGADDQFLEPGALPSAPRPRRLFNLLPGLIQKLIRNIILLVHDLFDAGLSFSSVGPDTFLIDSDAFHPVLSIRAFHQDVVELVRATREQQIDLNMKWIANLIEHDIIATSDMPEELKDGLIPLMRRKGASSMLYVIANHSSLVPIENRLELYSRMFVEIGDVLYNLDPVLHNQVLSTILFPDDWKALESEKQIEQGMAVPK
ncbi:hypothetical protein U9M48_022827, partial [Paspalum notatum var. saurae]